VWHARAVLEDVAARTERHRVLAEAFCNILPGSKARARAAGRKFVGLVGVVLEELSLEGVVVTVTVTSIVAIKEKSAKNCFAALGVCLKGTNTA
jgi:hypothetical protein